jgi:hypothetical protein
MGIGFDDIGGVVADDMTYVSLTVFHETQTCELTIDGGDKNFGCATLDAHQLHHFAKALSRAERRLKTT